MYNLKNISDWFSKNMPIIEPLHSRNLHFFILLPKCSSLKAYSAWNVEKFLLHVLYNYLFNYLNPIILFVTIPLAFSIDVKYI